MDCSVETRISAVFRNNAMLKNSTKLKTCCASILGTTQKLWKYLFPGKRSSVQQPLLCCAFKSFVLASTSLTCLFLGCVQFCVV